MNFPTFVQLPSDLSSLALPAARALVHFLWQGALVALLAAGVLALMRRSSAGSRYGVALGALVLMATMPLVTLTLLPAAEVVNSEAPSSVPATASALRTAGDLAAPYGASTATGERSAGLLASLDLSALLASVESAVLAHPDLLVAVWALGVMLLLAIHTGGVRRLRSVLRSATDAPADWQTRLDHISRSLGVGRLVELRQSGEVDVPFVAGWLRPTIVVPTSAFFGLTPEQLDAVLGHELAHVRRADFLVNLFQVAMETVFFYHPGVWWLSRRVRIEREHCCDDLAVAHFKAPVYVRALATLEGLRQVAARSQAAPSFAQGVDGGSLLARVRRLAGQEGTRADRPGLASQIFGTALAAVLAAGLAAAGVYLTDTGTVDALPAVAQEDGASSGHDHEDHEDHGHDIHVDIDWHSEGHHGEWLKEEAAELRAAASGTSWSGLDDETFEQLARWGFDEELFSALDRAGIAASSDELKTIARYGVDEDLILAMGETDLPADVDTLARLGRYGVDGDDLLEYQRAGLATSGDDVLKLARYGMDGDDIAELAEAGYPGLSTDELLALARHGVDGDDVAELAAAGYTSLTVDELVRLARHGMDGDDIAELSEAGYPGLSVDQLVELARYGLDGDDIAELSQAGLTGLSLDEIRDLARHGVDGKDVEEWRAAGLNNLSLDEMLELARRGVDGADVDELTEAGLRDLSVDQILSLARYGIDGDDLKDIRDAGYDVSFDEVMRLARSGRLWHLDDDEDWDDDWDADSDEDDADWYA